MNNALDDRILIYLAGVGLVFLVGATLAVAVASVLATTDAIRRANERRRHLRIVRTVVARTDFDTALINLTKEDGR
jgi:Na+-transporting methylmalonyl-CoA/oxaloacetate decarboxylase gamma subunit